jgi:hypothetical protein
MIIKQFDMISWPENYRIELYGYTGDNRIHNENEIPENTSTLYKNTNN